MRRRTRRVRGEGAVAVDRHRLNLAAAGASITVATVLIALKGWAQITTGSLSIAASLVDSVLDLMVSLANLAAIRYAARPPDADHSFGHSAVEDIAALAQAAIVTISGLAIGAGAAMRLMQPQPLVAEGLGLTVMVASVVMTGALVAWQSWVARRTGSRVVGADMAHYLTDFLPALGAIAALAASRWADAVWLDPALALVAAGFILRTGLRVGRSAWDGLMDREAPTDIVARIGAIADAAPGVRGWHDLKTRMSGTRLFVQIHVEIDGDLTLHEAHDIARSLRSELLALRDDMEVIVHQDPV